MKALSLFANIGVAEAYLSDIGIEVVVANELDERRAKLYQDIYPACNMICGDITDPEIFDAIISASSQENIDIIIATPPCQGMSTAGPQTENDARNYLILPVLKAIDLLAPKYVFIENVPLFLSTSIIVDGISKLIPDIISERIADKYHIDCNIIDTADYGVPQTRERTIFLCTRKDQSNIWHLPEKDKVVVTMRDAIGDIPSIDPFVKDVSYEELLELFPKFEERKQNALKLSPWNIPPVHVKRQVVAMMHTPTGATAFDNKTHYPIKEDGSRVRGYHNTYKRQNWDSPAYTVTMDNRKISSQNNVHPGRVERVTDEGEVLYSDPRTLTLYELMRIMSLPDDWPVPPETSEAFLRRIIGEGIPPLFVKKAFLNLVRE